MKLRHISTKAPIGTHRNATIKKTKKLLEELYELHLAFHAEKKNSILVVLQGMDASGKDGSVKALSQGLFPMGWQVHPFKSPSELEQSMDYLWRIHSKVPAKGMVGIFNRSHYEDILVPTVHKTLPRHVVDKRYKHINEFEKMLEDTGTVVVKFFLHVSKEEQAERFKKRFTTLEKKWKYDPKDIKEASRRDKYTKVYERIFEESIVDWNVVPADDKWYRNYVIVKTLVKKLRRLNPRYPNTTK